MKNFVKKLPIVSFLATTLLACSNVSGNAELLDIDGEEITVYTNFKIETLEQSKSSQEDKVVIGSLNNKVVIEQSSLTADSVSTNSVNDAEDNLESTPNNTIKQVGFVVNPKANYMLLNTILFKCKEGVDSCVPSDIGNEVVDLGRRKFVVIVPNFEEFKRVYSLLKDSELVESVDLQKSYGEEIKLN